MSRVIHVVKKTGKKFLRGTKSRYCAVLIIHYKYSRKSGRPDAAPYLSPRQETGHSVALVYHNAGGIDLARAATAVTGGALHGGGMKRRL